MKNKTLISVICILAVLLLAAPFSYAWFADSLQSDANIESYVHKSYFESGDGTAARQFAGSGLSDDDACAYEIKYPVQLYYFAWLQALGYFNQPEEGETEVAPTYFYLSQDLDMSGWILPQIGTQEYPFIGNFDGNGHTISNLTVQNAEGTGDNAWTDKPEDINGLNIVGFFGVVGGLGGAGAAGQNYALPGNAGTAGNYTYATATNEVKNFTLVDATVKTDLAQSLAGIAAGYVNGTMENVKVVGGTLHSTATTALTYTANLSDYGAVGYCTADYRGTNSVVTVYVYDPQVYTNANGSAIEQGNNWGNSVEIQTMYEDLNAVYSGSGSAITYANSVTVTHHADGTVTEVLSNDGTTVNLTVQTYPVHVTEVDDDGNVIASYALIEQNATSDFVYLYGEHLADTVTQQVTDVYEKDSYYIYHDDGTTAHNLAFSGTAFSDEARANATKWVIEDSGTDTKVIYTIIGNNKYYLKNDAGALAYTGAGVTAAVPADATEWTVTDTTISNDGRYLCFRSNEWRLMLQDRLLITDDNEVGAQHFLTVVNGNYADTMVRDDAVSWTKTMASDDPDETEFYLSATVGTTTYYLSQNNGNLLLQTIDSPNASTAKWKYKAATETEKSKVYTVYNNDGDGYALYYEDSDDVLNWALTDFSEVAAGSGSGDSFGDSIPMQTIYNQLKAIRDTYSVTTYTNSKLIIVDEAEGTTNETTTTATLPTQSSTAGNWSAQVRTYQFLPYGQVTLTARSVTGNNDYIYVTDTSDTNPTNVVKVVYHAETESAMYISSGGNYLNLNAAGSAVTTAAPTNGNTKWRLTNQGYLRSEINGVWYYLNATNALTVGANGSTQWTLGDDNTLSYTYQGLTWYLTYNNGWAVMPGKTAYYIYSGTDYLRRTGNTTVGNGTQDQASEWFYDSTTGRIRMVYNNTVYYLNATNALALSTTANTVWTRDNNNGRFSYTYNGATWYLRCNNGTWGVSRITDSVLITDGTNYLTYTGSLGSANAEANATEWVWDPDNGRIYTFYNNTQYYLNASGGTLSASGAATTAWTYDSANQRIYYNDGTRNWYLRYSGGWSLYPTDTTYAIHSGGSYFGVSGTNFTLANSASAAWALDGSKIYTVINGTPYYLVGSTDGSGALTLTTTRANGTDFSYTLGGGTVSYTGNGETWYVYERNGAWTVFPAANAYTVSQNGVYLNAASNTTVSGDTDSGAATLWVWDGTNGRLSTYYSGSWRYLNASGSTAVLSTNPSTTWTRGGDGALTSGGQFLFYEGAWNMLDTNTTFYVIKSGDDYLSRSGTTLQNGDAGDAVYWRMDANNRLYVNINGTPYYLRAQTTGISLNQTASNGTVFNYDSTNHRMTCTIGGNTYYLVYDGTNWTVRNTYVKSNYIATTVNNTTYYLNGSSSGVSTGTVQNSATKWVFNGTSGTVSTDINGTVYYLVAALETNNTRASTNLTMSDDVNQATTFNLTNNNLTCTLSPAGTSTTYRLAYDSLVNKLKIVDTSSTFYTLYVGSGRYLDLNGTTFRTDGTSDTDATLWSFSNAAVPNNNNSYTSTTISTLVNGSRYYLFIQSSNDTSNRVLVNTTSTTLRYYRVNYNGGSYVIRSNSNSGVYLNWYESGNRWTVYTSVDGDAPVVRTAVNFTAATVQLIAAENYITDEETATVVSSAGNTFGTVSASTIQFDSSSVNLTARMTDRDYSLISFTEQRNAALTVEDTDAQTFTRTTYTEPVGETYFPLSVDNTTEGTDPYTVAKRNTGYIISGYSDETGDIRVSQYRKTDITNSLNNTNNSGQLQTTQIYTRNASGPTLLTTTYVNNNFKKYSDSVVNGETVEGSLTKLNRTLSGTQNVYGLHFMNAQISTNNLAVLPYAKINGKEYTDYQMPKDSIDFTLKERGYINFFAGTYYSDNNCFFSLHKIERYEETDAEVIAGTKNVSDIKSIKEIKAIYGTGNESDPYVYKFSDTDYETWTFYPSGNIKEHNTYSSLPPGYSSTALFDTSWITDTSINYQSSYANRVFYFEIPVDKGEYALGSVSGGTGAYLMYLDIGTAGTALKPEGNARLEEIVFNDLTVLHSDAGTVTYTVTGGTRPYEVKTNPTYFPLAWEAENGVRTGEVADTNTGYVISGANTDSRPPGDIRVSRYTKYANGNWASIRASLTSQDSAGILNDSAVYTIIDGQQVNIADYGIGKLYTMQYGTVAKSVNAMLSNNQYVYGLHFMQATISKDSTVTAEKAVINGVEKTNYVMPQDCIDFNVATKGRIAFMAGTYFSGSNGVQSFFSLHRIFRDGSGAITDIKQLSEIYTDGDAEHGYIYRFAGDAAYYNADGTLNGNSVPSGYVLIYDLTAIDDPTSLAGISGLTQNSVYYFEIPVDAGEYALGSSNSDGAYLIYLDIAANASFAVQTVITEVTVREEYTNHFPLGVAFVDSADSTAFDTNGAADPGKSGFISIPAGANSNGDTVFAMTEDGDFSVTNAVSSLAGYTVQTIAQNGSLTVNGVAVPAVIESTSVTEKVTVIMLDLGGTTTTTVTTTTQTTEGNNAPVTTVTQTVTTDFNGSTSTSTTSPAPSYNGHTLIPDDLTSQTVPRAEADKILVFNFVASGVDVSAERSGMPNIVETEYVITVNDSAYTVFDVAPDNNAEPAVPAATYNVVLTGTAGTYEVTIATADAGFVFNLGGAQVEEGDTVTVTVAAGP